MSAYPWQDVWDELYSKAMEQFGMTEPEAQLYADKNADQEHADRMKEATFEMTICAKCSWLHADAKRDRWYHWMCAAAPINTVNPVSGIIDPPYKLCRFVNQGACWMYKQGPNILAPKEVADAVQS